MRTAVLIALAGALAAVEPLVLVHVARTATSAYDYLTPGRDGERPPDDFTPWLGGTIHVRFRVHAFGDGTYAGEHALLQFGIRNAAKDEAMVATKGRFLLFDPRRPGETVVHQAPFPDGIWLSKAGFSWSDRPLAQMRVQPRVLRGSTWEDAKPHGRADVFPLRYEYTVVLVPPGGTFAGWDAIPWPGGQARR